MVYMRWTRKIGIPIESVKDWWAQVIHKRGEIRKAMAFFTMLVS
jgi:hypothetical protein